MEGRKGEGREKGREGRAGQGWGKGRVGPKLNLGPRTIFLTPALWKAHIGLPISVKLNLGT